MASCGIIFFLRTFPISNLRTIQQNVHSIQAFSGNSCNFCSKLPHIHTGGPHIKCERERPPFWKTPSPSSFRGLGPSKPSETVRQLYYSRRAIGKSEKPPNLLTWSQTSKRWPRRNFDVRAPCASSFDYFVKKERRKSYCWLYFVLLTDLVYLSRKWCNQWQNVV